MNTPTWKGFFQYSSIHIILKVMIFLILRRTPSISRESVIARKCVAATSKLKNLLPENGNGQQNYRFSECKCEIMMKCAIILQQGRYVQV